MLIAAPNVLRLLVGLCVVISANLSLAQEFVVPRDGSFYVESQPTFTFKATLADDLRCPHARSGTLHVYAPVLPEIAGQEKVSTHLFVEGHEELRAKNITELSPNKRMMLALEIRSRKLSPKDGIPLRLEYEGTLFSRTLKHGKPPMEVPDLTNEERRRYTKASTTMDHNDAAFLRWMKDQGLRRRDGEQSMGFAHRVYSHFINNAIYGGDTSSYETRRPSQVCKSFANDCGGLSLLFVAVMRANDIPSRTLFGRWAIPQSDDYGQYHVIAEFFVEESGWVPVDISGTIVHKPRDPNALFGNTDGQFLAFHLDVDLEPEKGFEHGWAQYLLSRWDGTGDFGKDQDLKSKWDVTRLAVEE
jgi:hypothetical protein